MEVVAQSLVYFSGQSCYDAVEVAANTIHDMYNAGVGSAPWKQLENDFKVFIIVIGYFTN